jgi:hypothetical protein
VLVLVVVLGLLARKAIDDEHDHDDDNGRRATREFPARARGRRRLDLLVRKAIDEDEHD